MRRCTRATICSSRPIPSISPWICKRARMAPSISSIGAISSTAINPAPDKWDRTNGRIYRVSWAKTYHPVKVNLSVMSDLELAKLQLHQNDWYCRASRQLLQERAATGKVDPQAVAWLKDLAATSQETSRVLRALWTLHVIGALDAAGLTAALQKPERFRARMGDPARHGKKPGAPLISTDALVGLAKQDPSATVRLALASAMPELSADACWSIGGALAEHGEDAKDRFLPKMIWFGLAPAIEKDFARGLALARTTPLPSLADSIRWDAATHPEGRELLVDPNGHGPRSGSRARIAHPRLRVEKRGHRPPRRKHGRRRKRALKKTPGIARWPRNWQRSSEIRRSSPARGPRSRTRIAPPAERRAAFDLLKRIGDQDSAAVFATLLDQDEYRSAVIPLLAPLRRSEHGRRAAPALRFV